MVPLVESSEESEEQDDVMSLEEEEELRARVGRQIQSTLENLYCKCTL